MEEPKTLQSRNQTRFGGLSLIFLAVGIVGPFFNGLPPRAANPGTGMNPIGFGLRGLFVVLALIFGIVGRRSRAGRVGMLGSGVLLAVVAVLTIFLFSRHATERESAPLSPPSVVPIAPQPQ